MDVVRVKLTVTNNDAEAWSPVMICDLELYQDGIGLPYPTTWDMAEPTAEDEAYETELEPGQTVKCNALYYLRNQNPVEVVIESPNTDTRLGARFDVQELLIGTWVNESDGETYSFNADGTGYQILEGVTYGFSYELDGDYLQISYDDGDSDACDISISGNTLTIAEYWTYTRQ